MSLPIKVRPILLVFIFGTAGALTSLGFAYQASLIAASRLINPSELVRILQSAKSEKPLMIQVGSHVLYTQAHIPGAEYIGPPPVRVACSPCGSEWNPCRETSSSFCIAGVVRGATVRTSSLPTTPSMQWALPM